MVLSAAVALAIIGVRAVTLMPVWLTLVGIVLPGVVILTVTLIAAIWPALQGILLTAEALGFFVAAMMLLPKVKATWLPPRETPTATQTPAQPAPPEQPLTPPASAIE